MSICFDMYRKYDAIGKGKTKSIGVSKSRPIRYDIYIYGLISRL